MAKKKKKTAKGSIVRKVFVAIGAVLSVMLVLSLLGATVYSAYFAIYEYDYVYPNITINGATVSGMTYDEMNELIQTQVDNLYEGKSVKISILDKDYEILPTDVSVGATVGTSVQEAWRVGREGGFIDKLMSIVNTVVHGNEIYAYFTIDEEAVEGYAREIVDSIYRDKIEYTYEVGTDGVTINCGLSGRDADYKPLYDEIIRQFMYLDFKEYEVEVRYYEPTIPNLDSIYEECFIMAENARYNIDTKDNYFVEEHVVGRRFDLDAAKTELTALKEGSMFIPFTYVTPDITTDIFTANLFKDVLYTATSTYKESEIERTTNVKLAAQFCNEVVLNPGDIFSFNGSVGQRTYARGFKDATTYVGGQSVEQVGGGICQVSSTIYMAAVNANLKIVERKNHQFVVAYTPYGQDATVYWGSLDFRFQNDTNYPLKLVLTCENGILSVSIIGTKKDTNYVVFRSEVISTTPFEIKYEYDETVEKGVDWVKQTAYTGRVVYAYRDIYDQNGTLISSTLENKSTYKKRDRIIVVGTKGDTPAVGEQSGNPSADVPVDTQPTVPPAII